MSILLLTDLVKDLLDRVGEFLLEDISEKRLTLCSP